MNYHYQEMTGKNGQISFFKGTMVLVNIKKYQIKIKVMLVLKGSQ